MIGRYDGRFTALYADAADRQITDRVSLGYYEAGHMMYIRPSAHKALKQDAAKFIRAAMAPARASAANP
jgi:hypothetical protein